MSRIQATMTSQQQQCVRIDKKLAVAQSYRSKSAYIHAYITHIYICTHIHTCPLPAYRPPSTNEK